MAGAASSGGRRGAGRRLRWDEYFRLVEGGAPGGVFAFCGPESFLKREALAALKRAMRGGGGASEASERYAVDSFRLGESPVGEILSAASQAGLFGGDRLVWVEGLERFGRLGQKDRAAWMQLAGGTPPNPVILESAQSSRELARRSKSLAGLLGAVTVVDFWPLYPQRAATWVRKRGERLGLQIAGEAAALMVRHLGTDLLILAAEIEKIALLHGKGPLASEDLRSLARRGALGSAWNCVEEIIAGHAAESIEGLAAVRGEESAFSFGWKLSHALSRELTEGGGGGFGRGPGGAPGGRRRGALSVGDKNLLGRLLWGCYQWERHLKSGAWSGAHDYTALDATVLAYLQRRDSSATGR
jgi:DNA polymerase III delta subunit